jgi:ankyrin repeat protein
MDLTQKLFQSIMDGNQAAVAELINVDSRLLNTRTPSGVPAVLFALYYGQPLIVRLFLERGAAVDIFTAAAVGMIGPLKELIAQQPGIVDAIAPDGFSPLGLAAFFGQKEAVELLLGSGAQVNVASHNPQHVMPLHSAVAGQSYEIARLLVENGADVNARQAGDFTPLHAAAQNGQVDMVQLLLDHAAEVNARTSEGHSSLYFARESNSGEIIALMESKGAVD